MKMILPNLKDSSYLFNYHMSELSSMRVGGISDVYFAPNSMRDLQCFLREYKGDIDNVFVSGNMSNVVITDDGLECTLSLENLCNKIEFLHDEVNVGAGVLANTFINECVSRGVSCCEDLYTIPGRIGGLVYMNAGIPSFEVKDRLLSIECIDKYSGEIEHLNVCDLKMGYRSSGIPRNLIILSAKFSVEESSTEEMQEKINGYRLKRLKTQPITAKTCGSTFKNPRNYSAWQLIRESGAHEISVGGASMSPMHSNFLINNGNATASDVIKLIDIVRDAVVRTTGIELELELQIIKRRNV